MDVNKEFADFLSSMENFNINIASDLLSDTRFNIKYAGEVIELLGKGLTKENFKIRPDYFNFCKEQLLKMANNEEYQESLFDFLDIIEMDDTELSSSVLIAVTVLENTKNPNQTSLEYFLIVTFNNLNEMDDNQLKEILPRIMQLLIKLNKHFQLQQSILYHFARVAFLVLRANIDPIEYLNLLSDIIYDPFYLLEHEFDDKQEKLYMASFFYLYFKTGMQWGPKIYNQFYVLENCCNLAMSVYDDNQFGKSFTKLILTKFKNNEIPLHSLNKYHENFLLEAAYSSRFNEQLDVRKESFESLMIFLNKLSTDAQYVVLKYVFLKRLDTCIKAEMIIKMKDLIILKLKTNQILGCFQGIRLLEMIRLCCNIPKTRRFCVVKNKEQVLAAISLVYYLSGYHNEKFNMGKEFSDEIKTFVTAIQNAIDYAHEQQKLETKNLVNKVDKVEFQVQVNNSKLSELSINEKRDMLLQFNTVVKMMQLNLDMLKRRIIEN